MKPSLTTVLILVMTSYLCDACYFTNCPNKWNWKKRSDSDVINENLEQRAEANPLLKSYLEKSQQQAPLEPMEKLDYDDTTNNEDTIINKLLKLLDRHATRKD